MNSQNRKKIAIISDAVYPFNKGGKEMRLYELTRRLPVARFDVHIYTMKWWNGERVFIKDGITFHAISKLYPLYSGNRRSIKQALFFSLACFRLLKEEFDVLDVDHMPHLVLFTAKLVALLKRKKLIATWHEVWGKKYWISYMGKFGYVATVIEKLAAQLPDCIIVDSVHTQKKFITTLSPTKPMALVSCGIDFDNIETVKPSAMKSDIIYAGRLLDHKNIDLLIKAIAEVKKHHPKITCIIIGEGPEKENLMALAASLDIQENITFLNFLEKREDVLGLIKSSRLFVFPSTREGFGLVTLEANACGIPVLTTNHRDNASQDLIRVGVTGYAVNPFPLTFAHYITVMVYEQVFSSENIKEIAKTYSWKRVVPTLVKEYLQ